MIFIIHILQKDIKALINGLIDLVVSTLNILVIIYLFLVIFKILSGFYLLNFF